MREGSPDDDGDDDDNDYDDEDDDDDNDDDDDDFPGFRTIHFPFETKYGVKCFLLGVIFPPFVGLLFPHDSLSL